MTEHIVSYAQQERADAKTEAMEKIMEVPRKLKQSLEKLVKF